jgi:(4S)-4-hydroxy-5-phosphonooxypentane-2,3-dione isomerase
MTHIMMPTLYIQAQHREEFFRLISAEVEHSLRVEPGILRFDLARDQADPDVLHVYAVYKDEAAYAFHLQQPYYQELMSKIAPLFSREPTIRVATNLLPRDADWAKLYAARTASEADR